MKVVIDDREVEFRRWTPGAGRVFRARFAFRAGCTPADEARPWLPTAFVVGAGFDGERGCFVSRRDLALFLAAHEGVPLVLHDAAEALEAIDLAARGLDVYRRVEDGLVEDPGLLHRLLRLAVEGQTDPGPGRETLAGCASAYRVGDLTGARLDSRGDPVDRSHGRWLNRPFGEIEPACLRALAEEAVVLRRLHRRLRARIRRHLDGHAAEAWGHVSPAWLAGQGRRWGPLTHHIQLRAAIVLRAVTARGLHLDLGRRSELLAGLDAVAAEQRARLHGHGYLPGQPSSGRALRSILGRIERRRGVELARTASGDYATSEEALASMVGSEPFIKALLAYRAADQLQAAFLDKMGRTVVHPSFDVLKTTGRTSSFGEINAQNLPRDDRVRSCFSARSGHVLVAADFRAIEMVTLAQANASQFGLDSALAAALNAGRDPHAMVAALATGKTEAQATEEDRRRAKPINFGLPGAMGHDGLKDYARTAYDVELDDDEVEALTAAWFELFPEMREFLRDEVDVGLAMAEHFGLTPSSYAEHTGSRRFLDHSGARGREGSPSPALGWMLVKVLGAARPATRAGRPYDAGELDHFWSRARALAGSLPAGLGEAVLGRRPSSRLRRAALALVDAGPVFTLTGRLRAAASFPARHNTVFLGLASDGSKLALWKAWRAGYAIVNFVHDELLVEVPEGPGVGRDARELGRLMVAGMREVTPGVRVEVRYVASRSWSKGPGDQVAEPGRIASGPPGGEEADRPGGDDRNRPRPVPNVRDPRRRAAPGRKPPGVFPRFDEPEHHNDQ